MSKKKTPGQPVTQRTQSQTVPVPAPSPFYGPNTITLSTDMSTIYLIDGGRAIPFSLNTIGGVLVGEIKGQLTVVSAFDNIPTEDPSKNLETFSTARAVGIPVVKTATVPTNKGNWNFIHIREQRKLCIIGAVDIDVSIQKGNTLEAQAYLFDLQEGFINIQRVGNSLVFDSIPVTS